MLSKDFLFRHLSSFSVILVSKFGFVPLNSQACVGRGYRQSTIGPGLNCTLFNADFPEFIRRADRSILLMPTYEYSCEKCGKNFDAFQSMRDEPYRECPKELCRLPRWGHGKVKRLFGTGAGLIFKGSGFYITDYRSDSYKEAAKKETPATPSGGEKSTAPKESAKGSSPAQTKAPEKKPVKEDS
jgi:putative FmdB family regulatory protein